MPRPFYIENKDKERFDFCVSQNTNGMYSIVASVSKYVKSTDALGSYLLGIPPSNESGKWVYDHVFKKINVETNKEEKIELISDVFETIENNFIYIYKNAKSLNNLGENLIIYVDSF